MTPGWVPRPYCTPSNICSNVRQYYTSLSHIYRSFHYTEILKKEKSPLVSERHWKIAAGAYPAFLRSASGGRAPPRAALIRARRRFNAHPKLDRRRRATCPLSRLLTDARPAPGGVVAVVIAPLASPVTHPCQALGGHQSRGLINSPRSVFVSVSARQKDELMATGRRRPWAWHGAAAPAHQNCLCGETGRSRRRKGRGGERRPAAVVGEVPARSARLPYSQFFSPFHHPLGNVPYLAIAWQRALHTVIRLYEAPSTTVPGRPGPWRPGHRYIRVIWLDAA
jgi:hypothetical protein